MSNKSLTVVNIYAGAGCGKSTTATGVFSYLKSKGVLCEYVPEFAKDLTWDENFKVLSDQIYVFAEQQHRLKRLVGKVDVAIVDSPLPLSVFYDAQQNEHLKALVMQEFNSYNNMNFFLERSKPYVQVGRTQTLEQAKEDDIKIHKMLDELRIPHVHQRYETGVEDIGTHVEAVSNYLKSVRTVEPIPASEESENFTPRTVNVLKEMLLGTKHHW